MFNLKKVYSVPKRWAHERQTRHVQVQQWSDADEMELRTLARPSMTITDDTTYRPHSMHLEETESALVNATRTTKSNRGRRHTSGWRFGALNGAVSVTVVLIINLTVTIVFSARKDTVLFDGDCDRASKMNTGVHLLINILSTVLLSASNYCMQCLSAPTRSEVDDAHAQGRWLDIGVQSLHNLRNIHRSRAIVWILLGISSLPLHLFYNSAVFLSLSSNDYIALSVEESFLSTPYCADCVVEALNQSYLGYSGSIQHHELADAPARLYEKARDDELDRLSNLDCILEYAKPIQTKRKNLLLVAADGKMPTRNATAKMKSTHAYALNQFSAYTASDSDSADSSYGWICHSDMKIGRGCPAFIKELKKVPEAWNVSTAGRSSIYDPVPYPVDYCLSERAEPRCKVQFILTIAILVVVLNFFKAGLIFYTALGVKENPLMTMGDAVASFLERRDKTTEGMCLLSLRDVKTHGNYFPAGPKAWTGKRERFKDVTSHTRRTVTFACFFITLTLVASLLGYGIQELPSGTSHAFANLASMGYGTVDARTIMAYPVELSATALILIANIAQPILSFLYFSYNGLFTAMLLGYEWVTYAHRRKGLRVSRPAEGAQRSTYFLQLPYRFALPLMVLSGLLHWLVSQSIFLVSVDVYRWDGSYVGDDDFMSTGYSPIAIFTTVMLGLAMTLGAIGIGYVPFREGMNVAGSCSAAISAACHEIDEVDGSEAARSKLKWGVVKVSTDGVGHCAFSTREVEMPRVGHLYAG